MADGPATPPDSPKPSPRAWAALGILGAATAFVTFGFAGLLGNSLHPAVSPSLRLILPVGVLFVGVALLLVGGLVYREAAKDGELPPDGIRSQPAIGILAAGIAVGLLLALSVPVPAPLSIQVSSGPYAPIVPGSCYSFETSQGYSLPVQSNVRVHWTLGGTGGYPYVNVSDPSGTFVYQGEPGSSGSGSFTVPSARTTPVYLVTWTVLVCTPGANATLDLWINATQQGPLL